MRKYDFEKMGGIWKDEARTITEKGIFIANSGNWDLWEYSGIVYSIPVSNSGCRASVWCVTAHLKSHLQGLKYVCGYDKIVPNDWRHVNYDFLGGLGIA